MSGRRTRRSWSSSSSGPTGELLHFHAEYCASWRALLELSVRPLPLLLALIHRSAWKVTSAKLVALLEFELLRAERPSEAYPGGLDELWGAYDLFDLGLGAVAPYVVFSEYLLQGHILLHAAYDVIGDLLLTRGEGGASCASEEPLPEGWPFAHEDP